MSSSPFFTTTPLPEMPNETVKSIEMVPLNRQSERIVDMVHSSQMSIFDRIIEIIVIYEKQYRVFSSLNMSNEVAIFVKIRDMLLLDLNIEIETLFQNDYSSFKMILAAFYGQKHALDIPKEKEINKSEEKYLEKDFLPDCQHPLHTLMVMCFAARSMQKTVLKDDFGEAMKQEKYENLKEQLEELACKIVNNFNLSGPDGGTQARAALQADYKSEFPSVEGLKKGPYEEYLDGKFNKSKEIMAIAYRAKAMKFLSQRPCLNLMRIRNECRKVDNVNCDRHDRMYKMQAIIPEKEKLLLTIKWKLCFHAMLRGFYIAMFAYMLCRFPVYDDYDKALNLEGSGKKREWNEFIPFFYVLAVLIAQVSMTFIKVLDYLKFHGSKTKNMGQTQYSRTIRNFVAKRFHWLRYRILLLDIYFRSNQLALWRIFMVIPLLFLESFRFIIFTASKNNSSTDINFWHGGWVLIPILIELLYCSLFVIATVSSLRFFHFIQSLGFFVHLFKKMWKTVGMFVLIFCTFWFVLAVIHVSISRTFMSSSNTIFYTVASQGKFEIFGEVQDDDRIGNLSDCSRFNRTIFEFFDMNYAEASCLFRSTVMPFLVFTYIFVTGILLVNLLTAQLTKEYEKESENSRYYKGYLKYEQLAKIESKLYLPPPLSLIYVSIRVLFFVSTQICSFFNFVTCRCFGSNCSISPLSRLIFNILKKLEGYSWGAVRDFVDEAEINRAEIVIKKFLEKSPDDTLEKLKEVVNNYDRKTLDVDNLKALRNDIDTFLEVETEVVRERGQSRIGTENDQRGNTSRQQSVLKNRVPTLDDDPASEASIAV